MSQSSERASDLRAAEYVLGTLTVDEATRVDRELEHDRALQNAVAFWEEQLGQLGLALTPVEPCAEVWAMIQSRLDERQQRRSGPQQSRAAVSSRLTPVWPVLAMAASVAALVLAALLYVETRPLETPAPVYASIFYDQSSATGWMLTASTASGKMSVKAVGDFPLPSGKELRLWIIPDGGKPIASGLVPAEGENSWAMSTRVVKLLRLPATAIAVSMETAGQPVSDGPQGPILWQARIRQRG